MVKLQPCVCKVGSVITAPQNYIASGTVSKSISWLKGMQSGTAFFFPSLLHLFLDAVFCELQHGLFCPDAGTSIIFCDQAVH